MMLNDDVAVVQNFEVMCCMWYKYFKYCEIFASKDYTKILIFSF